MEPSRRHGLIKLAAGIAVFCGGVAASLAIATPSAQPRSADCLLTVVCTDTLPTLPTTLPSLPTTLPTVTETITLPTEPGTTTGTTGSTTTGSTATDPTTTGGSSGQGTIPTTISTATTTVSTDPSVGHQRVSIKRFRAAIRRVGKRRWLTVTFELSKAGRGSIRLTIPRRRAFVKAFSARAGKNRHRFLLPARAGKGRRRLLMIVRGRGGDARVRAVVKLPS
jgi:hypothetical protein